MGDLRIKFNEIRVDKILLEYFVERGSILSIQLSKLLLPLKATKVDLADNLKNERSVGTQICRNVNVLQGRRGSGCSIFHESCELRLVGQCLRPI